MGANVADPPPTIGLKVRRAVWKNSRRLRNIYSSMALRTVPREKWHVLLQDRHEGYIDWDGCEQNQRAIADNTNRNGQVVQGAVRGGAALLSGLLRCGHCGRKLKVRYRADLPTNQYYYIQPIEEDNAGNIWDR
jgi:hypothetical protein